MIDLVAEFGTAWDQEIERRLEESPVHPSQWRSAGRKSKEWPEKENEAWWRHHAPIFIQNYITWRTESEDSDWRIWEPYPGEPAIEMGIKVPVGGVPVRGYIDRIFVTPSGELVIVDLKTGSRSPESDLQLGFYATLCGIATGIRPQWGAYWKAREGGLIKPLVDLDWMSEELLGAWLRDFVKARSEGIYLPVISGHCKTCGVRSACAAQNGADAPIYDPHHPNYRKDSDV